MPKKVGGAVRPAKPAGPVPETIKAKRDAIIAITNDFCGQHLTEEYAELARRLTQTLSRKRPSPLATGQARTWAGAVVYALGKVNFLFDKSQTPHLNATELCRLMGVSQASASPKAREILDRLEIMQMDPRWCLPSKMDDNLLVWLVPLQGGMIADIRYLPREVQEEAFNLGMIPYIPADRHPPVDEME